MTNEQIFIDLQKICEGKIYFNEPMSKHTSFKIGGKVDFYIKAGSIDEIRKIQDYAKKNRIPLYIVGNGSNLLVSDEEVRGIALNINIQNIKIEEQEDKVILTLGAGVKLMALAQVLAQKEIAGFEELSGIPGTIGGAIKMNAGAYGKEMKDIIISTKCMNSQGKIIELTNEEQKFSYRDSIFAKEKYIILETKIALEKGKEKEIKEKMDKYSIQRREKQPLEYPSAGSTFKRGSNFITAKIIDECGLRGYSIGGAQIAEKHAGFIINKGNATAKDVLDLIEYVKKQVLEKKGLNIEEEIEFIGIKNKYK